MVLNKIFVCFRVQPHLSEEYIVGNPNNVLAEKNAHCIDPINAYEMIEGTNEYNTITANCETKPTLIT